jgi:hypothetical protein
MALPVTSTFGGITLKVLAADSPNDFIARMCGFTQKGATGSAQTSTATVPDCDDPEAAAWDLAGVSALSFQFSLSGIAASEDDAFWNQWFDSGESKTIQWIKDGIGYREGTAVLTSLGETVQLKQDGNLVQRSVTLQSASAMPWTSGAPS